MWCRGKKSHIHIARRCEERMYCMNRWTKKKHRSLHSYARSCCCSVARSGPRENTHSAIYPLIMLPVAYWNNTRRCLTRSLWHWTNMRVSSRLFRVDITFDVFCFSWHVLVNSLIAMANVNDLLFEICAICFFRLANRSQNDEPLNNINRIWRDRCANTNTHNEIILMRSRYCGAHYSLSFSLPLNVSIRRSYAQTPQSLARAIRAKYYCCRTSAAAAAVDVVPMVKLSCLCTNAGLCISWVHWYILIEWNRHQILGENWETSKVLSFVGVKVFNVELFNVYILS